MAFNIDPCTFEFLFVAKELYDYDLLDKVLEGYDHLEVCEDYYSLVCDGIASVFKDFSQYYKDDTAVETLVFFDPVITEFYRLCAMYEEQKGVSKKRNPLRKQMEQEVYRCFCLDSYDFDLFLCDSRKGAPKLVFLSYEEFYGHSELPGALVEARNTLERHCAWLRVALALDTAQTNAPDDMRKEAA